MRVYFRGLVIWLLIITAESINGTVRELLIVPIVGTVQARRISFFVALIIITAITLLTIRWVGAGSTARLITIGLMWACLTVGFEYALGRYVFGISTEKFLSEYDPRQGGPMLFGLVFLVLIPLAAARIRRSTRPGPSIEPLP